MVRVRAMVKMAASWWGEVSMLGEGSLVSTLNIILCPTRHLLPCRELSRFGIEKNLPIQSVESVESNDINLLVEYVYTHGWSMFTHTGKHTRVSYSCS